MCLWRRVDMLKCSCNWRVFTDAACMSSRFLEQHQCESVHITYCVLFQRRSFDASSAIYECWTKVAHSLKLSFELSTHGTSQRLHMLMIGQSEFQPYRCIQVMVILRYPLLHCFMANTMLLGRWIMLFTRWQAWLATWLWRPLVSRHLSVQIQFCLDTTKNCSDFFWLLDVISSPVCVCVCVCTIPCLFFFAASSLPDVSLVENPESGREGEGARQGEESVTM